MSETAEPTFPPLMASAPTPAGVDPMTKAVAAAAAGVDAGTVFWSPREDAMEAAIALAPETTLEPAMAMAMAAANGLSDALGALAPPEVAVTWDWPNVLRVNGARCGAMAVEADVRAPGETPNWLVIGICVQLRPVDGRSGEPGEDPSVTALSEEGCPDLTRTRLLESYARHTLLWITRWLEDGIRPLHDAYIGRVERKGEPMVLTLGDARREGLFVGLDDEGAMLLKTPNATEAVPLSAMLGAPLSWPPQEMREAAP